MKEPNRHKSISRSLPALVVMACACACACVPRPGPTKYFRYSIDFTVGGKHYLQQQDISCAPISNLSEANFNWVPGWRIGGAGVTAVDVGSNLALLYSAQASCEKDLDEWPRYVSVVRNPLAPEILYTGRMIDSDPPITINREWTVRIDHPKILLQPSASELALKEIIRDNQHGFQRVTYSMIPYEQWAGSDQSRQYFSRLTSVAVAKVGEAPPINGYPDQWVQFPFFRDRVYPKRSIEASNTEPFLELAYNGEDFVMYDWRQSDSGHWYPTKEAKSSPIPMHHDVTVRFKGVVFTVNEGQEVYDPETKTIYFFTNWDLPFPWPGGGPDEIDIKREMTYAKAKMQSEQSPAK